jgi:hypothetical protein
VLVLSVVILLAAQPVSDPTVLERVEANHPLMEAITQHAMPKFRCIRMQFHSAASPPSGDAQKDAQVTGEILAKASEICGLKAEVVEAGARVKTTFPDLDDAEAKRAAGQALFGLLLWSMTAQD